MKGLVKENSEEKEMKEQQEKVETRTEKKENTTANKDENKKEEQGNNTKNNKNIEKKSEQKENVNKEKCTPKHNIEEKKFEQTKGKEKEVKKIAKEMETNKNKKLIKPIIISLILIIALTFFSTIFALININNDKIISGISISGIDVSGLTKEEANAKIMEIYQEKKQKEIEIKYEDYETTLNLELMEVNYDVEKAVEEAVSVGKSSNIFVNNYDILFTLLQKKNINVNMAINEDVAKQTIQDIGINLPGGLIESSYAVEEDELIITKGKAGIVINTEALLNEVKENLNDINIKED